VRGRRPALQPRPARILLALGYLGWFISPWLLMTTTVIVAIVLWRRQFASDSRRSLVES